MNLSEQVANRETECEALRSKSEADDNLIALLKQQNQDQADKLLAMQKECDGKIQLLTQERDEANARAQEVRGLIETLGRLTLQGLDRMQRRHDPAELDRLLDVDVPKDAAQATIEKYKEQLDPISEMDPPPLFLREPMRRAG